MQEASLLVVQALRAGSHTRLNYAAFGMTPVRMLV